MTINVRAVTHSDDGGVGNGASYTLTGVNCLAGEPLHIIATVGNGEDIAAVSPITNTGTPMTFVLLDNTNDGSNSQRLVHWIVQSPPVQTTDITVNFTDALATFRGLAVKHIAESSGYDAVATAAHAAALNASPGTGVGAISSGNTSTLSGQPALVSGFCMSTGVVDTNTPDTAAGFALDWAAGARWQFGLGVNMGTPESRRVTATTAVAATFTAGSVNGARVAVVAVFLEGAVSAQNQLAWTVA